MEDTLWPIFSDTEYDCLEHALLLRRCLQTILGQVKRMCDRRGTACCCSTCALEHTHVFVSASFEELTD